MQKWLASGSVLQCGDDDDAEIVRTDDVDVKRIGVKRVGVKHVGLQPICTLAGAR